MKVIKRPPPPHPEFTASKEDARSLSKLVSGEIKKKKDEEESLPLLLAQTFIFLSGPSGRKFGARGFISREQGKLIGTVIFPNGSQLKFKAVEENTILQISDAEYQASPDSKLIPVQVSRVEGKSFQWQFQIGEKTALALEVESHVNTRSAKAGGTQWGFKESQPGLTGNSDLFAEGRTEPTQLKAVGVIFHSNASMARTQGTNERYEIILNNGDSISFQAISGHHGMGNIEIKNASLNRLKDQDSKRKISITDVQIKTNSIIFKCNGSLSVEVPIVPPGRGESDLKIAPPDQITVKNLASTRNGSTVEPSSYAFVVAEEELEKLAKPSSLPTSFTLKDIVTGKQLIIDLYHDGTRWVPLDQNGITEIMIGSEAATSLIEARLSKEGNGFRLSWEGENQHKRSLFLHTDGRNIALATDRDVRRDVRGLWAGQKAQMDALSRVIPETLTFETVQPIPPEPGPSAEYFPANKLFLPVAGTRELLKREPVVFHGDASPRATFTFLASPQPPGTSGLAADFHQYRASVEMEWDRKERKWIPVFQEGKTSLRIQHYKSPKEIDWEKDFPCTAALHLDEGAYSLVYGEKRLRFFESNVGVYMGLSGSERSLEEDRESLASLEVETKGRARMRPLVLSEEGRPLEYVVERPGASRGEPQVAPLSEAQQQPAKTSFAANVTFTPVTLEEISDQVDLSLAPHPHQKESYLLKVNLPIESDRHFSELEILINIPNSGAPKLEPLAWVDGILHSNAVLGVDSGSNRTGLQINGTPLGNLVVTVENKGGALRILQIHNEKQSFSFRRVTLSETKLLEIAKRGTEIVERELTVEEPAVPPPTTSPAAPLAVTKNEVPEPPPTSIAPKPIGSPFRMPEVLRIGGKESVEQELKVNGVMQTRKVQRQIYRTGTRDYQIEVCCLPDSRIVISARYKFPGMQDWCDIAVNRRQGEGELQLTLKGPYAGVKFVRGGNHYISEVSEESLRLGIAERLVAEPILSPEPVALPPLAPTSPPSLPLPELPTVPPAPPSEAAAPSLTMQLAGRLTDLLVEASGDPSSDFFKLTDQMSGALQIQQSPEILKRMGQVLTLLEKPETREAGLRIAKLFFSPRSTTLYSGLAVFDPELWSDGFKIFSEINPKAAEFGTNALAFGAADVASDVAMAAATGDWSKFRDYSFGHFAKTISALSFGGAVGKEIVSRSVTLNLSAKDWGSRLKNVGLGRGVPLMFAVIASDIAEGKMPTLPGLAISTGNVALAAGAVYAGKQGVTWVAKTSAARFLGNVIRIPFAMATPAAAAASVESGGVSIFAKELAEQAAEFFVMKGLGKAEEKFFAWRRESQMEEIRQTVKNIRDEEMKLQARFKKEETIDVEEVMLQEAQLLGMKTGLEQMLHSLAEEREIEIGSRIIDIPEDYCRDFVVNDTHRSQYIRDPEKVEQAKAEVHTLYDATESELKKMHEDLENLITTHNAVVAEKIASLQ